MTAKKTANGGMLKHVISVPTPITMVDGSIINPAAAPIIVATTDTKENKVTARYLPKRRENLLGLVVSKGSKVFLSFPLPQGP